MPRRVTLPGADELFRTTGGTALQASSVTNSRQSATEEEPAASRVPAPASSGEDGAEQHSGRDGDSEEPAAGRPDGSPAAARAAGGQGPDGPVRRRARAANRRPSGRERHDEKITVYVSAEELMDLEHARLVLRGEHGLAVDRGRIVREAVAVVLADLESRGDASILVRRLRGR